MSAKRFYIPLVIILCLSVGLLGLSYSKESGVSNFNNIVRKDNNIKVIYEQNNTTKSEILKNVDNYLTVSEHKFSVVNLGKQKENYLIKLSFDKDYNDIKFYYSIDGKTPVLLDKDIIYENSLEKYGTVGDFVTHSLRIFADKEYDGNVTFMVKNIDEKDLEYKILSSISTYKDDKGDYRYFGEEVNNYLKYNEELYRIIGLIDGKVRIVSESKNNGQFDKNNESITIKDYLGAFYNDNINISSALFYRNWLSNGVYWFDDIALGDNMSNYYLEYNNILEDSNLEYHYHRFILNLGNDLVINAGDGTFNNPYEVSHEN